MIEQVIGEVLQPLAVFGGIALVILASARAKLEHRRLDIMRGQPAANNEQANEAILLELKALKQQMAEMHSTSHQFDISFDAALSRLEERVSRVETKAAVPTPLVSQPEETQRVGLR